MFEIARVLETSQCDIEQVKKLMEIWFEQWDEAPDTGEKCGWKLELFFERQQLYKTLIDSVWDKLTDMEKQFAALTDKAYDAARREKQAQ